MLVPNCPGTKLSGAKLSWCQIVRVPNCPFFNSWCQIVRVPNCSVPNCPTTTASTQEAASKSKEQCLKMGTCPTSSGKVNDAKSSNLLQARPSPYWFIMSDHWRGRGGSRWGFGWAGHGELFEIMRGLWEPIWYHRISGVDDVWRLA